MADRVAIFNAGKIVQVGTPEDVYERPQSRFVADFVGSSNILTPDFAARAGGKPAWTSLRPEQILVLPAGSPPDGHASGEGIVQSVSYQGAVTRLTLDVEGMRIALNSPYKVRYQQGDRVRFHWPRAAMYPMPSDEL